MRHPPGGVFRCLDCLSDTGFDKFLYDYFGERPALSAKKSTLRRTPPDAIAGWHQDGGRFRTDTRAVNLWVAFSSCGVDTPSIDIFAKRFNIFVERGGAGIHGDAVSEETAASCGEKFIVRPEFESGDALLFDEMALQRLGIDKPMTGTRYAVQV